ncbi:MAG: hypothetical protein Q9200_005304 [Gallowayella weberi]
MMNVWGQLPSKAITALFSYYFPKPPSSKITHITKTIVTEKVTKGHIITKFVNNVPTSTAVAWPQPSHATVQPATKTIMANPSTAHVTNVTCQCPNLTKSSDDWFLLGSIALLILLFAFAGSYLLFKYRNKRKDNHGSDIGMNGDDDTSPDDDGTGSGPVISSGSSESTSSTAPPPAHAASPAVSPTGTSTANIAMSQAAAVGTLNPGSISSSNPPPTQPSTSTSSSLVTIVGSAGASAASPYSRSFTNQGSQFRILMTRTPRFVGHPLVSFALGAFFCRMPLFGDILIQTIPVAIIGLVDFWTAYIAVFSLQRWSPLLPAGKLMIKAFDAYAKLVCFCQKCFRDVLSGANLRPGNWGRVSTDLALAVSLKFAQSLIIGLQWVFPYLLRFGGFLCTIDYRGFTKGILQTLIEVYDERDKARLQKRLDAGCQCPASVCQNNVAKIALDKSAMDAKDREIADLKARVETLENKIKRDETMHRNSIARMDKKCCDEVVAAENKTRYLSSTNGQLKRLLRDARAERSDTVQGSQRFKAELDHKPCTNCEKSSQTMPEIRNEKATVEEQLKETGKKLIIVSAENTELRKQHDEAAKKSPDGSEGGCKTCAALMPLMEGAQHRFDQLIRDCEQLKSERDWLKTQWMSAQEQVQDLEEKSKLQKTESDNQYKSCHDKLTASQWELKSLKIVHSSCTTDKDTLKQQTNLRSQLSSYANEIKTLKQTVERVTSISNSWRSASSAAYHAAFPHGSGARMMTGGPATMGLEAVRASLELQHGIPVTIEDFLAACNDQEKAKQLGGLKDDPFEGPGVRQIAFLLELWSTKVRTPVRLGQMLKITGLRKTTCEYATYGHPTAKKTVWVMCQMMDDGSPQWFGLRPNPPSSQKPPAESKPPTNNESPTGEVGRAETEYNMRFSKGFRTLQTSGDALLCGLYAPIETMKAMKREKNYKNLLVPTFNELRDIWTSHTLQQELRQFYGENQINNLDAAQIGKVLDIWGRDRNLVLQLGILARNNASFQTGTRGAIQKPFLIPHPEADDPICMVIWIHNDSAQDGQLGILGHWTGVAPN